MRSVRSLLALVLAAGLPPHAAFGGPQAHVTGSLRELVPAELSAEDLAIPDDPRPWTVKVKGDLAAEVAGKAELDCVVTFRHPVALESFDRIGPAHAGRLRWI
ncbi:MAG: hypothetical protein ACOY3Y_00675, partial [Acidobacteriota bacterium]